MAIEALDFWRKGLKSYGTKRDPVRMKLMPMFRDLRKNPNVFQLILLYRTAEEKAIRTDRILMSPKLKICSSLKLVIVPANSLSRFLQFA